jgi:hypothetical protein
MGGDVRRYAQQAIHNLVAVNPGCTTWVEDCEGEFIAGRNARGLPLSTSPLVGMNHAEPGTESGQDLREKSR